MTSHSRRFPMVFRIGLTAALLFLLVHESSSQLVTLSGTVKDAVTRSPLPAANVRVLGTSHGTIANSMGVYRLTLESGRYTVVFSYIGNRSDTLQIALDHSQEYHSLLHPSAIQMPEVLVTNEDPALAIMREVIARKKEWMANLKSYEFDAFTRLVMKLDTGIAMITESYSTGYWRQGDTLREVIRQKRSTENMKGAIRIQVGGFIVNFYDDNINFSGFHFVGPTSPEAFDYYDFKLERTRQRDEVPVYTIRVIPKSRITPLFRGKLDVIGDTYNLIAVDMSPNEVFTIPFVSRLDLRYTQQFGYYENRYWMPMDIALSGVIEVGAMGISFPQIIIEQSSVIYDFKVNRQLADSVFTKPRRLEVAGAEKFDTVFWAQHDVLPLTDEEERAYKQLDSTQTLDKKMRPQTPIGDLSGSFFESLSHIRLRYDRSEGFFFGLKGDRDNIVDGFSLFGSAGYGFSDQKWKYQVGIGRYVGPGRTYKVELEGFREFASVPDEGYYGSLVNAVGSILNKQDYQDYYYADGFRFSIEANPLMRLSLRLEYRNELERSAPVVTDFSVFKQSTAFRPNPLVAEGMMRSMKLNIRYGDDRAPLGLVTQNSIEVELEHSDPDLLASNFEFNRVVLRGEARIETFARRLLFPPTLNIKFTAGTSSGTLPPQRLFGLESRFDGLGPFGVLRGANIREFVGDRFISLSMEHNFRSIPFLFLDIPFLYRSSVEVIVHGSVAQMWSSSAFPFAQGTAGWYSEAGIGLSRIYSLLRLDATYRFTQPRGFFVSMGVAQIL